MSRNQTRIGSFVVLLTAAVMALLFAVRPASTQGTLSLQGDITSVTVTSPACSAGSFVATLTGGATKGAAQVGGTCVAEVGDISTVTTTANMGLTGGGTSGAVSVGLLSTCANGQVLVAGGTGTTWTCGSAGGESTVAGAGLTLTGSTVDVIGSTGITVLADSVTLSLAGASCASGSFMTALGATGTGTCSTATSIVSGTTNTMAKFTSATAVGDSSVTDTGSLVTVANLARVDIGTSGAVAALAGSTLIVEGAAATHNYFSMMTDNGVNGGILFNTPTAAADGYLLYDGTARRLGFAAGALQVLQITAATTSIFNNTAIGDAGTDTLTVAATATFTPIVTATGGVTTPANLTTTGTGDLVSGDALTVAGNATLGDATSDTVSITSYVGIGTPPYSPASLIIDAAGRTYGLIVAGTSLSLLQGALSVGGAATLSSTLEVTGTTNAIGTFGVSGTDASISSCGTSAAVAGEAQSFQLTVGTGITACVVALNRTFTNAPYCTFSAANAAAANKVASLTGTNGGDEPYMTSTTTTATMNFIANTEGTAIYNVFCPGRF